MKPKHYAFFALLVWLGVVGWVGSMILGKPQAFPTGYADADASLAAQIQLEIQQAEALGVALAALQSPQRTLAANTILALPPGAARGGADAGASAAGAGFAVADGGTTAAPRILSLIISGAGMAPRAMIDGVLVGVGATLADGAVVRRIEARFVELRDVDGQMHRLALREPGAPAPNAEGAP